ncbi:MAG: bifunctional aldolase/short-chain dehydrogenase, partial [Polyangiaceae bacterium]
AALRDFIFVQKSADETLALRTYTSRLLGADPSLVLHGGGNTSAKSKATDLYGRDVDVLYIKGSGWDLATIEPQGLPAVRMAPLLALRAREKLSDEEMVNELRLALLDASAPTPSIETLLHAFLPAKFVDHTHADAILSLADQDRGEEICRGIFGKELVWVPYVMPGFELAKRCAAAFEEAKARGDDPKVIVLERHGIFTFGETAKASYEKMIASVDAARKFIEDKRAEYLAAPLRIEGLEHSLLPRLRGAFARLSGAPVEQGPLLALRSSDAILRVLERKDVSDLVHRGSATPDHVIRTKPRPLFLGSVDLASPAAIEGAVGAYAQHYDAYFAKLVAKKNVQKKKLDPWPRAILVPRLGVIGVGASLKEADVVAEIIEHTLGVMEDAETVGAYAPVSREDLFDVEYWSLEQAKIKKAAPAELAGKIAIVTGAASGIGKATAEKFLKLGAHVVLVDKNAPALVDAHESLEKYGSRVFPLSGDVAKEKKVAQIFDQVVARFGGLDVVVSNAGNAPEGRLDSAEGHVALAQSLEVNLLAHNLIATEAARIFAEQRTGGCLLFNASKAAFNPGPGFGPYAVAKSALVALMRQYAIDLGKIGVRSNAVNADRIRTGLFSPEVVEARSKARGLSADAYFKSNLLEREVSADDVASAFAYLATARATTGCVVTVDGGNAAAFPR